MLDIKNLTLAYGQSRVVQDFSLTCATGETVAIMGRNGMGKTTIMKGIIGILRTLTGTITVNGKEVSKLDSFRRVRSGIAYVPQGRQIFSSLSVEENIRTGLQGKEHAVPTYIYEMFPILKEFRSRKGGNLSGGQQQQLAIARALVSNPKVLILDEPTEGIQPSIIKEIAGTLNQIKRERGLAIVVSEQVLSFALEVADRLVVIEGGRTVREDKRAEVDAAKVAKFLSV